MRAAFPGLNCCKDSRSNPGAPTLYFIFDVLWTDGADTTGKTLMERRGGELRQTVFLGWRDNKKAKEVVLERQ
jgi:hypothetical protein